MNMYAGSTPSGNTDWKVYTDSINHTPLGLYVDVDTGEANFSTTPLYYTSLGGDGSHWLAQGVTAIYAPTAQGFRVYIKYPIDFTPQQANQLKWHVNWVGIQAS
jgi:hypothetical protein